MIRVRYRDDATGHVARYAGQECGTATDAAEALALIQACPNGSQMELVPDDQHDRSGT